MDNYYKNIITSKIPIIMGIVNVTPDSFSDGGKYYSTENAVNHALCLIKDGADIIDIGGESSRPGSSSITVDEEYERVIPVIKEIVNKKPETIISIDTTKSEIASEAICVGAKIINDISGGTLDEKIFNVAAKKKTPFIIMHMKGLPKNMQDSPSYNNVIKEIIDFLTKQIKVALKYNVNNLIIDPGIGFGKRINDNFNIVGQLEKFKDFRYPILVGISKKSFLGKSLNYQVSERENATTIAETLAVANGANIIRTHNVKNAVELKKIVSFINKSNIK